MANRDRIGIMERRRALEAARNMLYSKIGKVVLDENKFPDRMLEIRHRQMDTESKKNELLIDNDMKMFKRDRLVYNLDPMIVLERPPSPVKPAQPNDDVPHYMTARKPQTSAVVKVMPTGPVIDAFTIRKKRKKNIWEPERGDEMNLRFRSIIMQSPPLVENELQNLESIYLHKRPGSGNEAQIRARLIVRQEEKKQLLREVERSDSPDAQDIFITQLERAANSRSTRYSALTNASNQSLKFNPFHLERFEKMRNRQKKRSWASITGS